MNSEMSGQELLEVIITGTRDGLGIRIVGGVNTNSTEEAVFGIFVKEVIKGSLAGKDGRLKRGDQLVKVNRTNLIGVSNENAVSILQDCAKSNTIKLLVSRSAQSQDEFRRLSNSQLLRPFVQMQPGLYTITPVMKAPSINAPVATSTPRGAELVEEPTAAGVRASGVSEGTAATNTRPSSASSNLTQVSSGVTTDMETDNDIDMPITTQSQGRVVSTGSTEVAVSDVNLTVGSGGHSRDNSIGGSPPPIPITAPPMFDDESLTEMERYGSATHRTRSTPEGKSTSPPLSANLPTNRSLTAHTFVIPKGSGLGIVISGGINRQDGPHIFIEKILDGMDAAKDQQLRKGDRILSVNGILFSNMTREKALTTLTQLKIRPGTKSYTIAVERPTDSGYFTGNLQSLPHPPRSITSSIFESDTLPVADQSDSIHSTTTATMKGVDSTKKATPLRYLSKKGGLGRSDSSKYDSMHKRMSMEPSARVKLDKLEWALNYMGYIISEQQQKQIRTELDVGDDGRVVFVDFVNLARELFAFKLNDTHLEANLVYALTQKDSLDLPHLPRKATSMDTLATEYSPSSTQIKLASSQPQLLETSTEQLDQMRQQLHDIGQRRDWLKLSDASGISGLSKQTAQDRGRQMHSKSPARDTTPHSVSSDEGNTLLRRRVGLAEAAAKASRDRANQLEDKNRRLEAELSVLHEQQLERNPRDTKTHLAAIDCELRKEKAASRRFQVATERLLQFVENCHEALVKSPDADRILYHPYGQGQSVVRGDAVTGNPRPPQYLSRHAKVTATTLAQEAKETIVAVQKLLQADTLPFGWDVAYTEDGQKYYINHETRTTSWVHPVTKVNTNYGTRASTPS